MEYKIVLDDKVEELVGLEPTHRGFAIHGITNFAIAPTISIIPKYYNK